MDTSTSHPVSARNQDNGTYVSEEMKHFFEACEILLHDMSPGDFSDKECNLLEHYSLELYVRFGNRAGPQAEQSIYGLCT